MKTIVIDRATDLLALSRKISVGGKAQAVADRLRRLNPHANLDELAAGTVLFVDDDAPVDRNVTQGADLAPLAQLVAQLRPAVDAAVAAALERIADRAREGKEVTAALRLSGARRAVAEDPDLKKRSDEFARGSRAAQARSDASAKTLRELQAIARAELDRLGKLAQ